MDTRDSGRSLLEELDDDSTCLTATNADGSHSPFLVPLLQRMEQRHKDAGSAGTNGMAQGYRAAVDVELVGFNSDDLLNSKGDNCECLVDLEEIDIGNSESGFAQNFCDDVSRRGGKPLWLLRG